ncbi:hypothetical protein VPH35_059607 [Triticum aestivum]
MDPPFSSPSIPSLQNSSSQALWSAHWCGDGVGLAPCTHRRSLRPVNSDGWVVGLDEKLCHAGCELIDLGCFIVVSVLRGDAGVDLVSRSHLGSTLVVRMLTALFFIASWLSPSKAAGQVVFILDTCRLNSATYSST